MWVKLIETMYNTRDAYTIFFKRILKNIWKLNRFIKNSNGMHWARLTSNLLKISIHWKRINSSRMSRMTENNCKSKTSNKLSLVNTVRCKFRSVHFWPLHQRPQLSVAEQQNIDHFESKCKRFVFRFSFNFWNGKR